MFRLDSDRFKNLSTFNSGAEQYCSGAENASKSFEIRVPSVKRSPIWYGTLSATLLFNIQCSVDIALDCIPFDNFLENRKRWNRGIVSGIQHFLRISRTGKVFQLFRLFHLREWNSWKNRNS